MGWADQMDFAGSEVPWHQKRIDLVILSDTVGVITIELKVRAWRRAISQAYINRWVSHQSWVALWHSYVTGEAYDLARAWNVGLLAVTANTLYPIVEPGSLPTSGDSLFLDNRLRSNRVRIRDLLGDAHRAERVGSALVNI